MKNSTFSICFFIKRSKLLKSGKAPLFMRITINGNRWETSMQVGVEPEKWDSNKEKARGSDRNSIMINDSIDNARYRVQKIKLKTEQEGKLPTLANIRYLFQDRQRIDRTIIKLFNEHNHNCVRKIGTQMAHNLNIILLIVIKTLDQNHWTNIYLPAKNLQFTAFNELT